MPVYISYGQQLLPHGQRVASSITMGVSWGMSGSLVAAAVWAFQRFDSLNHIFILFAIACGLEQPHLLLAAANARQQNNRWDILANGFWERAGRAFEDPLTDHFDFLHG